MKIRKRCKYRLWLKPQPKPRYKPVRWSPGLGYFMVIDDEGKPIHRDDLPDYFKQDASEIKANRELSLTRFKPRTTPFTELLHPHQKEFCDHLQLRRLCKDPYLFGNPSKIWERIKKAAANGETIVFQRFSPMSAKSARSELRDKLHLYPDGNSKGTPASRETFYSVHGVNHHVREFIDDESKVSGDGVVHNLGTLDTQKGKIFSVGSKLPPSDTGKVDYFYQVLDSEGNVIGYRGPTNEIHKPEEVDMTNDKVTVGNSVRGCIEGYFPYDDPAYFDPTKLVSGHSTLTSECRKLAERGSEEKDEPSEPQS